MPLILELIPENLWSSSCKALLLPCSGLYGSAWCKQSLFSPDASAPTVIKNCSTSEARLVQKHSYSYTVSFYQSFELTLSQRQKLKVGTRTAMKWRRVTSPLNKMGLRIPPSHQESAPLVLWCHRRLSSS